MHWLICLCSSYFLTNTCIVYSVKMIQCILTLHMYICRGVGQGCGGTGIEGAGSGGRRGGKWGERGRGAGVEGAGRGGIGGGISVTIWVRIIVSSVSSV